MFTFIVKNSSVNHMTLYWQKPGFLIPYPVQLQRSCSLKRCRRFYLKLLQKRSGKGSPEFLKQSAHFHFCSLLCHLVKNRYGNPCQFFKITISWNIREIHNPATQFFCHNQSFLNILYPIPTTLTIINAYPI